MDEDDKKIFKVDETSTLEVSNFGAYLINESGVYSFTVMSGFLQNTGWGVSPFGGQF